MNGLKESAKKHSSLIVLLVIMAVSYAHSMFVNRPWYDELYTYYYFVSRGPIYAAIHWPVPNNHMGYSVLAGVMDLFGNSYLGLRAVSVICSTINIYLIYRLVQYINAKYELMYLACFIGAYMPYSLAFQGRGYALSTTCLLIALNMLMRIAFGEDKLKFYVIWAVSLAWGLYTIPSSTYWVIPVCLTGGFFLLVTKDHKKMFKLIIASLAGAVMTFAMYFLVWLAIGSNLLSKETDSVFFGMYQLDVIKTSPVSAFSRGMQYMLDTPYIQSIDRKEVITGLFGYFESIFDQFYAYSKSCMGLAACIVSAFSVIAALGYIIGFLRDKEGAKDEEAKREFMSASIVAVFGISIPVMLIVQSVQPYLRVFSFFALIYGVMVTFLISSIFKLLKKYLKREDKVYTMAEQGIYFLMFFYAMVAVFIFTWYRPSRIELADRENDIADVLNVMDGDAREIDSIYYTDDFQRFVLKFYYDIEPNETSLEEADYVMLSTAFLENSEQSDWPMLVYYDSFDLDYLDENFVVKGETEKYRIYRRK